jgi:hypothetical protein
LREKTKNHSIFLEKTARFFSLSIGFSFKIQNLNRKWKTDQFFLFITRFFGLSPMSVPCRLGIPRTSSELRQEAGRVPTCCCMSHSIGPRSPRSGGLWWQATTRQDECYTVDHTPRGRIDKTGRVRCHLRHHHTTSAFNALDTLYNLLCRGATCRALGHSVTTPR